MTPDVGFAIPTGYQLRDVGTCRSCGARIAWCLTPRFRVAPLNADGVSHFATCPQAPAWRRRKQRELEP